MKNFDANEKLQQKTYSVHIWDCACGASSNLNDISIQLRNADLVLLAYDAASSSIESSLVGPGWIRRLRERTVARVVILACKIDRVPLDELTSVQNEMAVVEGRYGTQVKSACSIEPKKSQELLRLLLQSEGTQRRASPAYQSSPSTLVPSSPDIRRPRRPIPPSVTTTIVARTNESPIILDSVLPCCVIQ